MKDQILKIAGVKSEKEFYKKYPSEEAFMKAHGKEFNKAKLGKAIPKNQNAQYVLPKYDMPRAASSSTAVTYNTPTGQVNTSTTGQKKEDVTASTKAMGKAKKTEAKKRREKVAMSTAARESEKYNTPFTFPNGVTKDYADMTADEKAYVAGLSAETAYDISSLENPNSNFSLNELNPLSNILAPMESAIGRSLYEAKEKNSIRPIVSAALNPIMAGAISGIFSPSKSNIAAIKSMLDPTKEVKEAIALASASQEGRLINEAIKQGLKKGTKKLAHEAIDEIKNPSLATEFTAGEGNYGQPQLLTENIFNPNSTLATKMFKEGGQLHKLQQLRNFSNPPKAQDGDIGGFLKSVGNKNCVGATWQGILGDGASGGGGGAAAKPIPEWKEISNIENLGLDKAGRKALKSEYEAIKDKYPGMDLNTYVAARRDAERTSRQFANPERAKYFDQSGKLLPNVDVRNIDPYLRFYREKFPTQSKVSAEDILGIYSGMEGGLSNYEKYANVGYQKPMKEGGQLKKLQQLTDFGNPPIAQMGAYIGGQQDQFQPLMFNQFQEDVTSRMTGVSPEERKRQEQLAILNSQGQSSSGGGGDMLGGLMGIAGQVAPMLMGKKGAKLKKGQIGLNSPAGGTLSGVSGGFDWSMGTGGIGGGQTTITNPYSAGPAMDVNQTGSFSQQLAGSAGAVKPMSGFGKAFNAIGGIGGAANLAGSIIGGIQGLNAEKEGRKIAERDQKISELVLRASETMPEQTKRRYVRPEDQLVQPNQLFPTYGVGTNVLARDGASIGGNPTEIQNMYNPGDIYSDLGFEPLSDSDIIKQYRAGGFIPRAQFGAMAGALGGPVNSLVGSAFGNSAGSNLGSTLGSTIGMVGGPVGSLVGGAIGGIIGGFADQEGNRTKEAQRLTKQNLEKSALTSGLRAVNSQNSQFVRNGGDISSDHAGWMSHNWNPQVITKFGDVDVSQIHNIATEGMDTLRTGGHITQNNMFPTDQYALGGELKTTWGGYAEPISHNPYMPGSGETIMFRGKSHEESDGNGHTGIGVKYGQGGHDSYTDYAEYGSENADADVEVERGEPATEMIDGETGEKNMVVFGNLKISPMAASHIGDKNAKGKKYKHYVADLGKQENKQNKIVENATNSINQRIVNTSDSKLEDITDHLKIMGANMKLKDIATKKTNASIVQNAVNETAEERGLDADALAKGKIKIDKEAMKQQAKYGKMIKQAQNGDWTEYLSIPGIMNKIKQAINSKEVTKLPKVKSAAATTTTEKTTAAPPSLQLPTSSSQTSSATTAASAPKKKKSSSSSATTSKPSGYVSKYGIEPWKGNITGLGKKTASSFTAEEWDKIADRLGFKGRGNEEFEKFLLANPQAKAIIEKRHQDLYKKSPWIDPKHFGYGWAAPELKNINIEEEYQGDIPLVDIGGWDSETGKSDTTTKETTQPVEALKRNKWIDALNEFLPFFRPSDQEGFDTSQLYPEMAALAMNQLQPVQAQLYNPNLGTPMDISLQDQLNANQADFNALQRQVGYNPAALATLAANKYSANEKVLGEQFRLNQAEKQRVYEGNRALLNDAQLKNLGILDTQMTRQEQAKSNTKQQALEALKSMTDKIAKQKLENRTLGIYENLYNYRFDKSGRAQNWNPLAQFDTTLGGSGTSGTSGKGGLASGLEFTYDANGNIVDIRKSKEETKNGGKINKNAKNGNIVKAIKNL